MRNPKWTRDEIIIALDFYLRHAPRIPGKSSDAIAELSATLRKLHERNSGTLTQTFRNVNGVYMKLMNFRRFDPSYTGSGLKAGGKDEELLWNEYESDISALRQAAMTIRSFLDANEEPRSDLKLDPDEEEAIEGTLLTRTHKFRERNRKIVQKRKSLELERSGSLSCDACGFNFSRCYGERGEGFIECHHQKPVSELRPGEKTKINDLALVCSNCHRMIHRHRPWLTINELRNLISKTRKRT